MSLVHLLDLAVGETFRLTEGGPLWRRAPDRTAGDKSMVARVIPPDGDQTPIDARHLGNLFVIPTRFDLSLGELADERP